MKTLHILIIITGIAFGLSFFFIHSASAHLITDFSIQPDPNYVDPVTHFQLTKDNHPHIVLQRDSAFMLPMMLKSDGNNGSFITSYRFHVTDGNDFTAEVMPIGMSIKVVPDHLLAGDGSVQRFNIVIKVGKNTPSGIYAPDLVTKWNNNVTQSTDVSPIYFQVGKWNWDSLLKQLERGISAKNVICKSSLQLVIKSEDGSPACVKPDTAKKLIDVGWANSPIGVPTLRKPSIGLYNVTTSLQPIILGMSFFVNAEVVNNENTPITYYGGCVSPLSVSFDNIQTHTDGVHCLTISKYVLEPHEQVLVQSDKIYTVYNKTGPNYANAEIKFTYENNDTRASWFTTSEFPIQHAIKLNCTMPYQIQMEEINKSVNVQRAIALAYNSTAFLSKVKQYGNVSYMSFYNDLFPDQSCNAYWKGVEVMFTANDKNGARNIQVSEDIHLTKVLKVADFQASTN